MAAGKFCYLGSAYHSSQLFYPAFMIEFLDDHLGPLAHHAFTDRVVEIGKAGYLGLVSHAKNLIGRGELFEALSHRFGHSPAYPYIDLVKDEGAGIFGRRSDGLER